MLIFFVFNDNKDNLIITIILMIIMIMILKMMTVKASHRLKHVTTGA